MPEPRSHFELFGLTPSFVIDEACLHRTWLVLQQENHPDRHLNLPLARRNIAVEQATATTADINQAYQTLKDPLRRAIYLLALKSVELDEQETLADASFLEQMMQARMKLEEVAEANDVKALRDFLADIENRGQKYQDKLAECFAEDSYQLGDSEHLERLKQHIVEFRFYLRLLEQGRARLYQMDS